MLQSALSDFNLINSMTFAINLKFCKNNLLINSVTCASFSSTLEQTNNDYYRKSLTFELNMSFSSQ